MPKIKQFKDNDNNTTYDIYGQNVVDISYDDYQNLSEEQKNADIAYHIYDVPEDQAEPTKTVSGNVVSFDDGSAKPLKSLKVAINPVQAGSGDPSPSNVRPISGWTGANVHNYKVYQICKATDSSYTSNGLTISYEGNGEYSVKGRMTTNASTTLNMNFTEFNIYDGEDSYIALNNTFSYVNLNLYLNYNTTNVEQWGFTTNYRTSSYTGMRGKAINRFTLVVPNTLYGTDIDFTFKIELYSNDSKYIYHITWSEAGEVFGGKFEFSDYVWGAKRTNFRIDLGTLTWNVYTADSTGHSFYTNIPSNCKEVPDNNTLIDALCNVYKVDRFGSTGTWTTKDMAICQVANAQRFIIRDTSKADLADFRQFINGKQLIYELAEPIQFTLGEPLPNIKTLLGNNNIWSNTGEILECVYVPSLLTQIRYNDKVYSAPSYAEKANDANTVNGHTVETNVPSDAVFTDTTYPNLPAAQGGTDDSLVSTGEKWRWNNKSDLSTIAPPYDPLKSYKYGDFTSYDNMLYSCISPTTGTWDSTKWRSVTVGEILANLRGVIAPVMDINSVADMVQKDELLDVLDYGDQLVIPWFDGTTEYELPFNFCHLETVKDENDNDVKVADFEAEYVLPTDCVFDASEAIYASANDLAAGDYYFKIANDAWGNNNGKYVCFTLADTLTAGKQIRKKSGAYNAAIENCTLGIYTDGTDTAGTALSFTVETEEPSTGTSLGQTDGTGDLNHWHCVALGYNRYKYSAVRQYLNADAVKNTWWVQQHKWDVMPTYATTKDGFLYGLSADVKARLKTTKIVTARNTVFNSGDTPLGDMDITYDKVFLIGLEQSYISSQVEGEGEAWEYYKLLNGTSTPYQRSSTYADLIKYGVDAKRTARNRWLRSCNRGYAFYEWVVGSSGYVYGTSANNATRVAPCLRIG